MAARQRNFRATMSFLLIKNRMNVKLSCLILVIKSQVFLFPTFFFLLQISIKVQFPSLVLRDFSYFLYFPLKFWKEIGAQAAKLIMIYSHMPYV